MAEADAGYFGILLLVTALWLAGSFVAVRALKRGWRDGEVWLEQVLIRKTESAGTFWFAMVIVLLAAAFFVVALLLTTVAILEAVSGIPVLY